MKEQEEEFELDYGRGYHGKFASLHDSMEDLYSTEVSEFVGTTYDNDDEEEDERDDHFGGHHDNHHVHASTLGGIDRAPMGRRTVSGQNQNAAASHHRNRTISPSLSGSDDIDVYFDANHNHNNNRNQSNHSRNHSNHNRNNSNHNRTHSNNSSHNRSCAPPPATVEARPATTRTASYRYNTDSHTEHARIVAFPLHKSTSRRSRSFTPNDDDDPFDYGYNNFNHNNAGHQKPTAEITIDVNEYTETTSQSIFTMTEAGMNYEGGGGGGGGAVSDPKTAQKEERGHEKRRFRVLCVAGWVCALLLIFVLVAQVTSRNLRENRPNGSSLSEPQSPSKPNDSSSTPNSSTSAAPSTTTDTNATRFAIRINAGATEPYFDADGNEWLPDSTSSGNGDKSSEPRFAVHGDGGVTNNGNVVGNTGSEGTGLYNNERYFYTTGRYDIVLPGKKMVTYTVDLYFADVFYHHAGQRFFNIVIEGQVMHTNFDIIQAAGGSSTAARWTAHNVTLSNDSDDNILSIELVSVFEYPTISGLAIVQSV